MVDWFHDPQTGMPSIRTRGGTVMPLPLSPADMAAAGAGPAVSPDAFRAQLGAGAPPPPSAPAAPVDPQAWARQQVADYNANPPQLSPADLRAQLTAPAGPHFAPAHAGPAGSNLPSFGAPSRGQGPDARYNEPSNIVVDGARPGTPGGAVDPSTLVRPGQPGGAGPAAGGAAPAGDGTDDPLVRQAMAEAMRGGGSGGGPRGLGVTSETRKYKQQGAIPDAVRARANEALGASDAYNEQLAMSLDKRQTQAYDAQQAEYQGRVQAVADQRALQQEQQRHLADFEAKWDAQNAEAAQMKAPQMEDYWASKGTMAKMATAISITLGGALQGLRGGQNPGLEMSNQEIEHWIAGQREQYQRSRDTAAQMGNQYARMVDSYGSQNLAEQRLRDQAYGVRDAMMQSYAQHIGTPGALEAYNQAQLQSEAQRAALQEKAYADAGAEIEQKLSMQGGMGGGKPKGVLDMLRAGAEAKKLKDTIAGGNGPNPGRGIEGGKTEALTAALQTIDAADEIQSTLGELGSAEDDTDDPRSGAYDYITKNIPGTNSRKLGQNLDQATTALARGIQQTLGKSDNDAKLADQMATGGGGSGRERAAAAQRAKEKAIAKFKIELSGLTPDQRGAFLQGLPADQRSKVVRTFGIDTAPAASEQAVK